MKKEKPKFYAHYKNFNTGKLETIDVLDTVLYDVIGKTGRLKKKNFCTYDKDFNKVPIVTKEQLQKYLDSELMYHFWGKCEWEYVAVDWPCKDKVDDSRPHKIDVYEQLKPNMGVITDIVWDYVKDKI